MNTHINKRHPSIIKLPQYIAQFSPQRVEKLSHFFYPSCIYCTQPIEYTH